MKTFWLLAFVVGMAFGMWTLFLIWNYLITDLFGLRPITYGEMILLYSFAKGMLAPIPKSK